jgi:ABC-type antimicrobial peptide transport system permease subunit
MPVKIVGVTGEGQGDLQFSAIMPMKEFDKVARYLTKDYDKKKNIYETARIKVDDLSLVKSIQAELDEMGFASNSLQDMIDSQNSLYVMLSYVLSGIASISLVIAGIGIANTMMMSVNERRKEIGLMKVVGAKLSDIRSLFLFEASFIGLLGGFIGLSISYGCAAIINQFSSQIFALINLEADGKLSIIPLWLPGSVLAFTAFIGLISGYLPARKAMNLSALEAIQS